MASVVKSDSDIIENNKDDVLSESEKLVTQTSDDQKSSSEKEQSNIKKEEEKKLMELMKIDYVYPNPDDPEFQYKMYIKREFYYHRIPPRPNINDYNDIREYRDNICARSFVLHSHQAMLSNFINPDTPFRGVLIYHGLGTGKCLAHYISVDINGKLLKIEDIWNNYKT